MQGLRRSGPPRESQLLEVDAGPILAPGEAIAVAQESLKFRIAGDESVAVRPAVAFQHTMNRGGVDHPDTPGHLEAEILLKYGHIVVLKK